MKQFQLLLFVIVLTVTWSNCSDGQAPPASLHQIYGTIRSIKGSQLTMETRDKRMVTVDATAAIKTYRAVVLGVDRTINVSGTYDTKGVLHAEAIQRAKSSPESWLADR
jgi:hypothetical protein